MKSKLHAPFLSEPLPHFFEKDKLLLASLAAQVQKELYSPGEKCLHQLFENIPNACLELKKRSLFSFEENSSSVEHSPDNHNER